MSDTNQDAKVMQLAAVLPDAEPALFDVAKQAVVGLDAAVCAGDDSALALAMARYDAVVWKLNGGTLFGCASGPDAAAAVVGRHCAAALRGGATVGQSGNFWSMSRASVRWSGWKGAGFRGCITSSSMPSTPTPLH